MSTTNTTPIAFALEALEQYGGPLPMGLGRSLNMGELLLIWSGSEVPPPSVEALATTYKGWARYLIEAIRAQAERYASRGLDTRARHCHWLADQLQMGELQLIRADELQPAPAVAAPIAAAVTAPAPAPIAAACLRTYPMPCRSLHCGEILCPATCPHLPELEAFKAWKQRTNAHQPDPIWSPTIWQEGPPSTEPERDYTGRSHPYNSPALAGWGGGDR